MAIEPGDLLGISSFEELAKRFHDKLNWPKDRWPKFAGVKAVYEIDDLPNLEALAAVQRLTDDQEWGILLLDFQENPLRRSALRRVLNAVATKERAKNDNPTWLLSNILFICHSSGNTWTLGHFRGDRLANAKLKTFGWTDPLEARTAVENINKLSWGADWAEAWNVEKLTKDFFTRLSDLFYDTLEVVAKQLPNEPEPRLFVQTLFNRLLFLRFVEKKGWLRLNARPDYLRALWQAGTGSPSPFWPTRLNALFGAVNHPTTDQVHVVARPLVGEVEYLNGGLFEDDPRFVDPRVKVPEEVFEALLGREGLFYSYNFTVEESSPLDVQVAVDPEILGRIFEQLTISGKRHDTGSYYTPRGIVQFMCREAVVAYLGGTGLREDKARAFVYDHSTEELTNKEGDRAFESLKVIKVVDPACGSGAYLLGMLQELYALFALLQRQDRKFSDDPAKEDHQRKLHIIENNIYGVDLQAFATNTAMLRLWLTLLVEDTGGKPQPLPNLEYKIETGDSLLGPDPSEPINWRRGAKGDQALLYDQSIHLTIDELRRLRSKYQDSHGGAKTQVKREYEPKLGELREKVTGAGVKDRAKFDWRVEFFDVFLDDPKKRTPGFDVVLANPPYISARHMAVDKGLLSQMYASAYGSYDIYVVFMERALQLLRSAGHMVFITSNKYLVADYGKKIREMLATSATILGIIDLADCRGVFSALVSPAITFARNASCSGSQTVRVARLSGSEWEQLSHSMLIAQQLSDLQDHFAAPILLSVDSKKRGLLQRLEKDATPLGELGNLRTGVMGFDYWNVEPFVHELHESPACDGPHHRRLLTNSQIAPYSLKFGMPIRLYKDSYTDPCIDLSSTTLSEETVAFFEAPKIALRGVARECTAAPDTEGCALLVAVHGIAQSRVDYDFLIALLNSALVNRLHRIQFYGARIPQGSLRYPISFWADVPVRSPDPEVVTALKSLMAKASPTDHGEAAKLRQALDTFLFDMYEVTPAEMME